VDVDRVLGGRLGGVVRNARHGARCYRARCGSPGPGDLALISYSDAQHLGKAIVARVQP
jgi:hypothetical protein